MYLALHPDELVKIEEIARRYGISRNHLMKVVQRLSRAGYVHSVRGKGGGLRLKEDPAHLRLGDIIATMEPDFGLVECMRAGNECIITPACTLPRILNGAVSAFRSHLDRYTLADLVHPTNREDLLNLLEA